MLRHVDFDAVSGLTVECCEIAGERAYIVFTNGTYTTLGIDHGYEPGCASVEAAGPVSLHRDTQCLVRLGIFAQAEVDAARAKRDEEYQAQREAGEKKQYEQLRRKFEGK